MAEPPRTPTPEQRRAVRNALDEHYDDTACRYRQSFSDKALAAKLNCPAAWVTELRIANGLGPDVNEAASQREAEIIAIRAELNEVQDQLLKRFDDLQKRVDKITNPPNAAAA